MIVFARLLEGLILIAPHFFLSVTSSPSASIRSVSCSSPDRTPKSRMLNSTSLAAIFPAAGLVRTHGRSICGLLTVPPASSRWLDHVLYSRSGNCARVSRSLIERAVPGSRSMNPCGDRQDAVARWRPCS